MANLTSREQVFFSYSRKDKKWLEQFQAALKPLIRSNQFSVWDDTRIKAGDIWRDELRQALASAKVAVLLVSMNFYQSDFIAENELPPLLEAAQDEGLKILLVIVGHSLFDETELGRYQAVNDPSKPLAAMTAASREKEIIRICKEIKAAVTTTEGVQSVAPAASERTTLKSPVAHGEELAGRVQELERENAALEKARENASSLYEKTRRENDALQMSLTGKIHDLEANKWLHDLADQDRRFIDQRVYVISQKIFRHDLRKELYVDFKFTVLNASVYGISIDEDSIKGDIYFNARLLSKRNKIIENEARHCGHAEAKDFVVRQWLDRDEIADVLNSTDDSDEFRFSRLDIKIKGHMEEGGPYPKRLNVYGLSLASKPLRELYQKLDVSVLSASFGGYSHDRTLGSRGLRISVNVNIRNPRPVSVIVQSFKLVAHINGRDYVAHAKEGEIRLGEVRDWDDETVVIEGRQLQNLKPSRDSIILLEAKEFCGGWLQFDIPDVGFDEPHILPATLVLIDIRDDEHPVECTLTYKSEG